jgi:hypothetical protein
MANGLVCDHDSELSSQCVSKRQLDSIDIHLRGHRNRAMGEGETGLHHKHQADLVFIEQRSGACVT